MLNSVIREQVLVLAPYTQGIWMLVFNDLLLRCDAVALWVERWTSDREVAGLTPAWALLMQQP